MSDLSPLLHARTVALIGISTPDRFGGQVYTNLHNFGYEGRTYGINPRYETLYHQPIYPSLAALPEKPDLAILAVPNRALRPAFEEVAAQGIRAAVIFGSAHNETGDPRATEKAIAALARQHDIAICGPNCMGFLAFGQKLVVSGYPVVPGTPSGHITFISHSGSVFDSIWQNNRDLHFNYVISAGNEIATTAADYMHFALQDPTTRVIGIYLETVRDPAGFRVALADANARDIPVVVLKVGRSERGARLAQSHSGALAGNDAVYNALFERYNVRRVRSLDEMVDTLELFATGWRPHPRAIAATLDSGGERGLLVDLADEIGVPFAQISPATQTRLAEILDPGLEPVNPLDAWGTGNEVDRIYRDSLLALDADPATGLSLFAVDLMRESNIPPTYVDITIPALTHFQKPFAFLVNVTSAASEEQMARLRAAGIPVLMGTETGLRAVRHLFDYCERANQPTNQLTNPPSPLPNSQFLIPNFSSPLDEHTSKTLLAQYGLPVPPEQIAETLPDVLAAAEHIGYPIALKTANGILHKTDAGGLHLNVRTPDALRTAYEDLATRLGSRVLIQKMAAPGLELILGLINDPQFGMFLSLGLGGILVEVLRDTRLVMLPATEDDLRRALRSLRGAALLRGVRGQPPVDEDAILRAALSLAAFAADAGDHLAEVDINPLIARPDGVVAVDALIIPKKANNGSSPA
ncbi:MAG TPA: acetate--CoA ligase family protein [Anaerolineales bacterium]|nr:acetate--CoA ligase family protein [Anaerolineales bacterium]